jgi:hypothetical protein
MAGAKKVNECRSDSGDDDDSNETLGVFPIGNYTQWTEDFKKTVHDVLLSKVFP